MRSLAPLEISHPGFYRTEIPGFRAHVEAAPRIPDQTVATVSAPPTDAPTYLLNEYRNSKEKLGLSPTLEPFVHVIHNDDAVAIEVFAWLNPRLVTFATPGPAAVAAATISPIDARSAREMVQDVSNSGLSLA